MAMGIEQGDITKLVVDAIVNAASQGMLGEVYEYFLSGHGGI